MVGSRKDLFDNPNLLVNRIKDYRSAYGIIWAGKSSRMRVCLDWYMKKSKGLIFRHIAENMNTAAKVKICSNVTVILNCSGVIQGTIMINSGVNMSLVSF